MTTPSEADMTKARAFQLLARQGQASVEQLAAAFAAVREEEREACIEIITTHRRMANLESADGDATGDDEKRDEFCSASNLLYDVRTAIRARGEKT